MSEEMRVPGKHHMRLAKIEDGGLSTNVAYCWTFCVFLHPATISALGIIVGASPKTQTVNYMLLMTCKPKSITFISKHQWPGSVNRYLKFLYKKGYPHHNAVSEVFTEPVCTGGHLVASLGFSAKHRTCTPKQEKVPVL